MSNPTPKKNQIWRTNEGRLVFTVNLYDNQAKLYFLWFDDLDQDWNTTPVWSQLKELVQDNATLLEFAKMTDTP